MTCMEMYGNGAEIGMAVIVEMRLIQSDLHLARAA